MTARTVADYFRERHGKQARWRTARVPQTCGERFLATTHEIAAGERYFDTGDVIAAPFVTTKLCGEHAEAAAF